MNLCIETLSCMSDDHADLQSIDSLIIKASISVSYRYRFAALPLLLYHQTFELSMSDRSRLLPLSIGEDQRQTEALGSEQSQTNAQTDTRDRARFIEMLNSVVRL